MLHKLPACPDMSLLKFVNVNETPTQPAPNVLMSTRERLNECRIFAFLAKLREVFAASAGLASGGLAEESEDLALG